MHMFDEARKQSLGFLFVVAIRDNKRLSIDTDDFQIVPFIFQAFPWWWEMTSAWAIPALQTAVFVSNRSFEKHHA